MGDLIADRSMLFFDYLDSLGFISTQNYQHLRQKLIQADEKKLLIEVANYFQGVTVADWFELTSQVYQSWLSKINRQYQNDVSVKKLDAKQGPSNTLQSTPEKKSTMKDLISSAYLSNSMLKDSRYQNTWDGNLGQRRQSNSGYQKSSDTILVDEILSKHQLSVSPAKPMLNSSKLNFLASLFENLVSKRLLHAFYNIQYAAIETNRNQQARRDSNSQLTKPIGSAMQSHASSGREGTFERSLKIQYQLLEQIKKASLETKKTPQKANKSMLLNKYSEPERIATEQPKAKSRRSDSMSIVSQSNSKYGTRHGSPETRKIDGNSLNQTLDSSIGYLPQNNNTVYNTRQASPESGKIEGNSRNYTPDRRRSSKKVNFQLQGQRRESEGLGIDWQSVKEYAALAESHSRANTLGNQPPPKVNKEEDQFYAQFGGGKHGVKANYSSPYKFDDTESPPQTKSRKSRLDKSMNLDNSVDYSMHKRSASPISLNASYDKNAGNELFNRLYRDADKKANNLRLLEQKLRIERGETFEPNLTKPFKLR